MNEKQDFSSVIIVSMAKGWGGAEEYLENLREGLSEKCIDHRIIVREDGEYARKRGIDREILKAAPGIRGIFTFSKRANGIRTPTAIHVNRYYDILRGWYLRRVLPDSLLFLYQHCFLNHPHRIPLQLTDGIVCISEFVKSSITVRFPAFTDRIHVIKPGIDLTLFGEVKNGYQLNGPVRIGMAGRFDKNQEDLLLVARQLKTRGVRATVHFAGSGKPEEEKNLKALTQQLGIADSVVFNGHIHRKDMPAFYRDMDICASTMKREGLSLCAMEAMSCGLPFVAYNAPGFNEVMDDQENGILVNGGVEEFASALQDLIESLEERRRIGVNAAEKAHRHFGMDLNIQKYIQFVNELIRKKGLRSAGMVSF